MKWRPFKSYLGRPLNLPTGKAWYKEDILNAESQFVKQFDQPQAGAEMYGELYRFVKASERLPEVGKLVFVIAQDTYKLICQLDINNRFHEWPNGNIDIMDRWKSEEISWLEPISKSNQDELWDELIDKISLWSQDEDDARARSEFRKELSKSYHLIKKQQ